MKLNKKGFMMVEVIVVSTIVMGTLIGIYTSYGKVFSKYSDLISYNDVDGIYKLMTIRDKMISSTGNDNINIILSSNQNYIKYSDNVYIFNKNIINSSLVTGPLKDYLNYLNSSVTFSNNGKYIMVIELEKNDKYYYNYLELEA